jgi:hydrogenase/urease accessory protein HupE
MTSASRARRHPMWLVFGCAWFGLALWSVADGEPFWQEIAIGGFFIGAYLFPDADRILMSAAGLILVVAPDVPGWLRVVGALMAVVGLSLIVGAIARSRS